MGREGRKVDRVVGDGRLMREMGARDKGGGSCRICCLLWPATHYSLLTTYSLLSTQTQQRAEAA